MERSIELTEEEEKMVLEQIKYLNNEYVSIQQAFVSMISISVGAYALVLYYVFSDETKVKFIFLLLPFLFALSVFNIIKYTMRMMGLDAYIRHLERLVNYKHEKVLFSWQSFLIYANGYSMFGLLPQIPCYIVMMVILGTKYHQYINEFSLFTGFKEFMNIMLFAEIILLAIMLLHVSFHYHTVLQLCEEITVEIKRGRTLKELEKLHTAFPPYLRKLIKLINNKIKKNKEINKNNNIIMYSKHNRKKKLENKRKS